MTKHTERLMSRASVATMAAFAPKPEPVSTLPEFAERVDEAAPSAGSNDPLGGLTAEEQAQVDAMNSGTPADVDNVDHGADVVAAAPGDGAADGDDDDGDDPAADAVAAPAADGSVAPRQPPRTISYGRHQKELAKAQKERDDLQAMLDGSRKETAAEREQRVVLNTRTQMLLEAINTKAPAAAPAADADPEPNVDEDPLGHALWGNRQLRKRLDAVEQGQTRQQEETVAQQRQREAFEADQRILDASTQEISAAAVEAPEVADAFIHYRESRYTELGYALAGIDINDAAQCATLAPDVRQQLSNKIQQSFRDDCLYIAKQARERGRPIVGEVMQYARARGYKPGAAPAPAAADPPASAPAARNGNGAPAAPAPRAAPAGSVKDQLDAVRQNLDASRSLSDAGGSPGGSITPQQLADMPPAEFERYYAALKDSGQLDQMLGKPANM